MQMSIAERVRDLLEASPVLGKNYYALSLSVGSSGVIEYGCQTYWVGYTDEEPRREIRKARIVDAERLLESWRLLDEPGMVVNAPDDFILFFAHGGNAVVEKGLAEAVVPDWLAPGESVNVGECGFASPTLLPSGALRRAPSPKLRMSIIRRDGYKCRVCGRSPHKNVDIELHVHHVRPWAAGGVTEESNLMTLCHTCHVGLDPHFEFSLFRLMPAAQTGSRAAAYAAKLQRYQDAAFAASSLSDA